MKKQLTFKLKNYLRKARWDLDEISSIYVNDKRVRNGEAGFKRVVSRLTAGIKAKAISESFHMGCYPSHSCRITVYGMKTDYIICRKSY